jgi:hypothetical protein
MLFINRFPLDDNSLSFSGSFLCVTRVEGEVVGASLNLVVGLLEAVVQHFFHKSFFFK